MDALIQLQQFLDRIKDRARGNADVTDAQAARQLLDTVKKELEGDRLERQQLKSDNLQLKSRIAVLDQEVAMLKKPGATAVAPVDEYVEHLGAVFVRKPGGRILDAPHCRQCKRPLKAVARDMPYSCPTCQVFALFRPSELNDVLLALRR